MRLEVFEQPDGQRTAIDMSRVEAVVENSDDVVTLVTSNDTYRVKCFFNEAVDVWKNKGNKR